MHRFRKPSPDSPTLREDIAAMIDALSPEQVRHLAGLLWSFCIPPEMQEPEEGGAPAA
jgi:hypothetical protein